MANAESSDKNVPKWILMIRNIVFIVIGILTAWNTYTTEATNAKLDNQTKLLDQTIKQKEFENELRFKVFEEVKNSLSNPEDSIMQEVVRVMVEQILADDTTFQQKMKTVLLACKTTKLSVREAIKTTENYNIEQKELDQYVQRNVEQKNNADANASVPVASTEKYRVDVFCLEDIPAESKIRAEKIQKLLKRKYPKYEIRMRMLPISINAREGYRIDSNQIRYEAAESTVANEIYTEIVQAAVFSNEQPKLQLIDNPTPNYISVFVRNM